MRKLWPRLFGVYKTPLTKSVDSLGPRSRIYHHDESTVYHEEACDSETVLSDQYRLSVSSVVQNRVIYNRF